MKVFECIQINLKVLVLEEKGQLEKNRLEQEQKQQIQPTFWGEGYSNMLAYMGMCHLTGYAPCLSHYLANPAPLFSQLKVLDI